MGFYTKKHVVLDVLGQNRVPGHEWVKQNESRWISDGAPGEDGDWCGFAFGVLDFMDMVL